MQTQVRLFAVQIIQINLVLKNRNMVKTNGVFVQIIQINLVLKNREGGENVEFVVQIIQINLVLKNIDQLVFALYPFK